MVPAELNGLPPSKNTENHNRSTDIMKTCPCNKDPFTPHFYIVKQGFTGLFIIFLFLFLNIDRGYSLEPPH